MFPATMRPTTNDLQMLEICGYPLTSRFHADRGTMTTTRSIPPKWIKVHVVIQNGAKSMVIGCTVLVAESAVGRDRNIITSQLGESLTSLASVTLCWA